MKFLLSIILLTIALYSVNYNQVKITPELSYVHAYHKSSIIKIHRIQDTKHKLTGEYAITYKPMTYIQPIKIKGIKTIGEVELLKFIKTKANKQRGLLIDARSKKAYKKSIPSAINIPSEVMKNDSKVKKILSALGIKTKKDGSINSKQALSLVIYSHANWCDKAPNFIKILLENGYPANKILYYRGGIQMWKILGFTTIRN